MTTNVRKIAEKCNIHTNLACPPKYNEPMKEHTTFRVGGPAALFIEPASAQSLVDVLTEIQQQNSEYFILGGGSNLVVSDSGFDIPVISTANLCTIETVAVDNSLLLRCGSGTTFEQIRTYCFQHSLGGLESFAGLPGTAGGAVYMNARCYGASISDVLHSVTYLQQGTGEKLTTKTYTFTAADWEYKHSPFQHTRHTILDALFHVRHLTPQEQLQAEQQAQEHIADRKQKGHFSWPSAGSVFKNNRAFGKPTGKIIEETGLRGFSIGGAQVAPWHGNFIINTGNATAADIYELTKYVMERVYTATGFKLECEIIFCGVGAVCPSCPSQ